MNQRIKELAKQSGLIQYDTDSKMNDAEKFAELLVQDMHRKVVASILITDVLMAEKGLTPTSEDYIRAIHKDFGVK
jgi:hypothetical protein